MSHLVMLHITGEDLNDFFFFRTNILIDAVINDFRRSVFRKASIVPHFMGMEQSALASPTTAEKISDSKSNRLLQQRLCLI